MKIYTITPHTNQNNKHIKRDDLQLCNNHVSKSTTLIALSLLSLATLAKSQIDNDCVYKNKIEQTVYQQNNKSTEPNFHRQTDTETRLSDEEKIHRYAIILSLIGFLSPALINIFSGTQKEQPRNEDYD